MDHTLVTIIVPTKNSGIFLRQCLDSIKKQKYDNIEIIVVDNYSDDNTKEIASEYTPFVYSYGLERSAQRNFGAEKSNGYYLLFIDSDMVLTDEVVSECVRTIKNAKNIGGIIIPEKSFGAGFWAKCKELEKTFYVGVEWMEAARFFNAEVFNKTGRYNEKLISGEDWDLSYRIRKIKNIGRIKSLIFHNEGEISLPKTLKKKYYYAKNFAGYMEENKKGQGAGRQVSTLERYKLFFASPTKLLRDPALGFGMLFMKTCEFGLGGFGYLFSKINNNSRRN